MLIILRSIASGKVMDVFRMKIDSTGKFLDYRIYITKP